MPQLIVTVEGVEIKHIRLEKDRTTLGRKPHNDIVFNNLVVSGEHCVFELEGIADVYAEDLNSTNGTYINGHMLKSRQLLEDGDQLGIGNFKLEFLRSSERGKSFEEQSTKTMGLDALGLPGTSATQAACLRVLQGFSPGIELPLVKAVTTFGQPGIAVVSVSHRRDGYYVMRMGGEQPSTLNGKPLGDAAVLLADRDVLEMAGTALEFVLMPA
jgi:hypothetical protein